ncbi:MAG: hypothetical protein ACYDA1_10440 [Vulcanimicrobiaceae bacterium]
MTIEDPVNVTYSRSTFVPEVTRRFARGAMPLGGVRLTVSVMLAVVSATGAIPETVYPEEVSVGSVTVTEEDEENVPLDGLGTLMMGMLADWLQAVNVATHANAALTLAKYFCNEFSEEVTFDQVT